MGAYLSNTRIWLRGTVNSLDRVELSEVGTLKGGGGGTRVVQGMWLLLLEAILSFGQVLQDKGLDGPIKC